MAAFLDHAYNQNNELVDIDDISVKKGAQCNCVCPHCSSPLIAKKGGFSSRAHHFAHFKNADCKNGQETALHLLAKEVMMEEGGIMLPLENPYGFPTGFVTIHDIATERLDETLSIRPDVEGFLDNGRRIIIEFYRSHKVQGKKYKTIVDNNIMCIEIDLNWERLDKEKIRRFITKDESDRKWIVPQELKQTMSDDIHFKKQQNPMIDIIKQILIETFDKRELTICIPEERNASFGLGYEKYNLSNYGYDKLFENSLYVSHFRTDLLLFRSKEEESNKGYLAICIRSRARKSNCRIPKSLRVIDIILRKTYLLTPEKFVNQFRDGLLCKKEGIDIEFKGAFKQMK